MGSPVSQHSSPEAKISLFRSLFRGRDDVYPRRFESRKTGKSGYSPACANEWMRGLCDKKSVKCTDCPNRRFLTVTDEVIRNHLSGKDEHGREFVIGVYPMLLDETCFFLSADFDKTTWKEDIAAIRDTCRQLELPAAIERSRSGNGAHLWLFFETAIPAVLARKIGAHLLTETMERRPDIGLDSYDRFFPNQDTLPKGGFGNLIALPLQKKAREHGNSLFLDDSLVPWPDQWAFLSNLRRIDRISTERIVQDAERRGRVVGEGFDDPRLDTLFLALPVSWRGTIAQYAGRLHRLHDSKKEVRIYDYADINTPILARMFDRRCKGYEAIGYTILMPASAVPGWPPEVPLPVEPEWKRDYAASVQRLIRDGVDAPLGNLFVHAARKFAPDVEGEKRARSSAEAFLYRRLETLSATAGKFRLNQELPISFAGRGLMEVDLLCNDPRLAIELDGQQHLEPAAYRSDRRKDALLQEHGYFVLRFLSEDVSKHLDDVLEAVLRTIAHLQK